MAKKMKRVRKQKAQLTEAELKEKELKKLNREAIKNCKCYKAKDAKPNSWRIESMPAQRLVDKLTRDHNVNVCRAWLDPKAKSVSAIHAINAYDTREVTFSYEDICEWYGWKRFSLSKDLQTISPEW